MAHFGAYGYRAGKHNVVGLDYRGQFRHYPDNRYYNGLDQHLSLAYNHRLTPRVEFFLNQGGAIYGSGFGGTWYPVVADPLFGIANPASEIFDNRTYAVTSMGGLTFHKSNRLSFSMGGNGFLVRRRSQALAGVNGYGGSGNVAYRLNRRNTIGVGYRYLHFYFPRGFGLTDKHMASLDYSVALSRFWTLGLSAGTYRAEVERLVRVPVDPVVAAIIGRVSAIEADHSVTYGPIGGLSLKGTSRRWSAEANYFRTVSPGNGVYLTSRFDSGQVTYSYTGLRRWNIGVYGVYSGYSALAQDLGRYQSYGAHLGTNYRVNSWLHFTTSVGAYRDKIDGSPFHRDRFRALAGITISPGETPLSLW